MPNRCVAGGCDNVPDKKKRVYLSTNSQKRAIRNEGDNGSALCAQSVQNDLRRNIPACAQSTSHKPETKQNQP